jgi:hypothetical protein
MRLGNPNVIFPQDPTMDKLVASLEKDRVRSIRLQMKRKLQRVIQRHSHVVVVNYRYDTQVFCCVSEQDAYDLSERMVNAQTGVMTSRMYCLCFNPSFHYVIDANGDGVRV